MAAAVTDRTKVVIVCTPNNPTGPSVTRRRAARLRRQGARPRAGRRRRGLPRVRPRRRPGRRARAACRARQRRADAHLRQGLRAGRLPGRLRGGAPRGGGRRTRLLRCRSASRPSRRPRRSPAWRPRPRCSTAWTPWSPSGTGSWPALREQGWELPRSPGQLRLVAARRPDARPGRARRGGRASPSGRSPARASGSASGSPRATTCSCAWPSGSAPPERAVEAGRQRARSRAWCSATRPTSTRAVSFERDMTYLPDRIPATRADSGRAEWPVEPDRYRLVAAKACPWANRAIIVRGLLGLRGRHLDGLCGPVHDKDSWTFDLDPDGVDPVLGIHRLQEAYFKRDPGLLPWHHRAGDGRRAHGPGGDQRLPADHPRPVLRVARPPPPGRAGPVARRVPRGDGGGDGAGVHRGQQRRLPLRLRRLAGGVRRGLRAGSGRRWTGSRSGWRTGAT